MTSQPAQKIERLMMIQCDNAFILYGPDLMLINKKPFHIGTVHYQKFIIFVGKSRKICRQNISGKRKLAYRVQKISFRGVLQFNILGWKGYRPNQRIELNHKR